METYFIEVTGQSLEEARAKARDATPPGREVVSEQVLEAGDMPYPVRGIGVSPEDAFRQASKGVPKGYPEIERRLRAPARPQETHTVRAPNRSEATTIGQRIANDSKGILTKLDPSFSLFGKRFRATIRFDVEAEIIYRTPVRLKVEISGPQPRKTYIEAFGLEIGMRVCYVGAGAKPLVNQGTILELRLGDDSCVVRWDRGDDWMTSEAAFTQLVDAAFLATLK
jgi:hypothetical protein